MSGLLHLVQRGGAWRAVASPSPLLAMSSVTAHPSTASVPVTVYDVPLLCGFNVAVKGLTTIASFHTLSGEPALEIGRTHKS